MVVQLLDVTVRLPTLHAVRMLLSYHVDDAGDDVDENFVATCKQEGVGEVREGSGRVAATVSMFLIIGRVWRERGLSQMRCSS